MSPVDKKKSSKSTANSGYLSRIRWGESYVSLFLGAIVVVVAAILGLFYVKLNQPKQAILPPAQIVRQINLTPKVTITETPTPSLRTTPSKTATKTQRQLNKNEHIYVVQKSDDLWHIAVKEYGSGYSWVSIAQANNLTNPGKIYSGDTLIIPSVTPILVQNNQNTTPNPKPTAIAAKPTQSTITVTPTPTTNISITGTQYTVQKGDTLWNIAVRSYGDGYKWVNISKANNLTNPGVIHSGNVLTIPRSQTL